jgi:hypothetical protein
MTLRLLNSAYTSENLLYESLITEAVEMHGDDFMYIPRTFVAKDEVLGEDRLSKFKNSYPVVMYLESIDGFEGQGAMMSKFGLQMDQQATLTVARRTWDQTVGQYGQTILPNRPAEGDLIYYPRTKALLEIMFVQHSNPFYQLGQLYVYKLTVEKFRYSSEKLETGVASIDAFNDLATTGTANVETPQSFGDNTKLKSKASQFILDTNNPFGDL